jgi:hypothetical protein
MGFLIGALVGGFMLSALFAAIIEKFLFRDLPPEQRAAFTVGSAYALIYILAGFGFGNGRGFAVLAGLYYIPGALAVLFWYSRRYAAAWSDD